MIDEVASPTDRTFRKHILARFFAFAQLTKSYCRDCASAYWLGVLQIPGSPPAYVPRCGGRSPYGGKELDPIGLRYRRGVHWC
jgi:hypothetical protein